MLKRTLFFGHPAYLSKKDNQLVVRLPETDADEPSTIFGRKPEAQIPIEDIGVLVLEHQQVIVTHALLAALAANNVAVITCAENHLPNGLLMPLAVNTLQSERFRLQIDASQRLKDQLWKQTVVAKIQNQAAMLSTRIENVERIRAYATKVKAGDTDNYEAQAAMFYWSLLFPQFSKFKRGREEAQPNNLFNYGYAILRAVIARSLIAAGLLPTLGIHHRSRYNAYCLADDVMEPYRPFADRIVCQIVDSGVDYEELTPALKKELLQIPVCDVYIEGETSPLMVAAQRTAVTLVQCLEGTLRHISYPVLKHTMNHEQ